jgi:hypothetical protein
MTRRAVTLPSWNAVGAGQTATLDLPVDRRYHAVFIRYLTNSLEPAQTEMEADITAIRVNINGKSQRDWRNLNHLNKVLAFNNQDYDPGFIPIYFSEPWRRSALDEDRLSWGMSNVSTFQIEADIASGATSPALSGFALIDNVQEPLSGIIKTRTQTVPVSATGITTVSTLPKSDSYYRLHAFETTEADISDVDIEVDQLTVFDLTNAQVDRLLLSSRLSGQAATFHIPFDATQRTGDVLPMVKADLTRVAEFRLDFNMAVAADFTLVSEILGNPD